MERSVINNPRDETAPLEKRPLSHRAKLLLTLVLFFLTGVVIWSMPHGYSVDLTKIGKGEDSLVLVHDPAVANSSELMHALDQVRPEYHRHMDFLVADLRTPEGQRFAGEQGVGPTTVVIFSADGRRLLAIQGIKSPNELRRVLTGTFSHTTTAH